MAFFCHLPLSRHFRLSVKAVLGGPLIDQSCLSLYKNKNSQPRLFMFLPLHRQAMLTHLGSHWRVPQHMVSCNACLPLTFTTSVLGFLTHQRRASMVHQLGAWHPRLIFRLHACHPRWCQNSCSILPGHGSLLRQCMPSALPAQSCHATLAYVQRP